MKAWIHNSEEEDEKFSESDFLPVGARRSAYANLKTGRASKLSSSGPFIGAARSVVGNMVEILVQEPNMEKFIHPLADGEETPISKLMDKVEKGEVDLSNVRADTLNREETGCQGQACELMGHSPDCPGSGYNSLDSVPENLGEATRAPAQCCVAIGLGLNVETYGEIQIGTPKAKIRASVDGEIEVNGVVIGKDDEVVHCLRSLLGYPLPDRPNSPEVLSLFFVGESDPQSILDKINRLHIHAREDSVVIGPGAVPNEDGEIVIRNNLGVEVRIKPGMEVSGVLDSFRSLFQLK